MDQKRRDERLKFLNRAAALEANNELNKLLEEANDRIEELEVEVSSVDRLRQRFKDQYAREFTRVQELERETFGLKRQVTELERELHHQKRREEELKQRMDDAKKTNAVEVAQLEERLKQGELAVSAQDKQQRDLVE